MSDRLRKSTKKQVISIILVLTLLLSVILSGCHGQSSEIQNKKFRKFTETLFCQEVASNTVSLHYTLKDPGQYGIQDSPVTFGYFNTDKGTRKISTENTQAALKRFSYRKLSRENRLTYDVLDYYLELSKKESDYLLYEEPMGTVSGVQTQIPVLLSEYQFQSKEDVDAYLELMKTTPDYFNSLIAFEQEKAQKGLFMASYTADTVIEQCQAFIDMGDSNYLISTFVDRIQKLTDLSESEKSDYIQKNAYMLKTYVLPAYQQLIKTVVELKDSGKNEEGLCYLPNGKEYYELTVQASTGSARTVPQLQKLTKNQMKDDLAAMKLLLLQETTHFISVIVSGDLDNDVKNAWPYGADQSRFDNLGINRSTNWYMTGPNISNNGEMTWSQISGNRWTGDFLAINKLMPTIALHYIKRVSNPW